MLWRADVGSSKSEIKATKMLIKKEGIKLVIFCGLAVAAFPFFLNLIINFGDWHKLVVYTFTGVFFGFLIAPELEKKYFPYPVLFQTVCGFVSGCIVALVVNGGDWQLLVIMVFTILGFTASMWVKHAPIP